MKPLSVGLKLGKGDWGKSGKVWSCQKSLMQRLQTLPVTVAPGVPSNCSLSVHSAQPGSCLGSFSNASCFLLLMPGNDLLQEYILLHSIQTCFHLGFSMLKHISIQHLYLHGEHICLVSLHMHPAIQYISQRKAVCSCLLCRHNVVYCVKIQILIVSPYIWL